MLQFAAVGLGARQDLALLESMAAQLQCGSFYAMEADAYMLGMALHSITSELTSRRTWRADASSSNQSCTEVSVDVDEQKWDIDMELDRHFSSWPWNEASPFQNTVLSQRHSTCSPEHKCRAVPESRVPLEGKQLLPQTLDDSMLCEARAKHVRAQELAMAFNMRVQKIVEVAVASHLVMAINFLSDTIDQVDEHIFGKEGGIAWGLAGQHPERDLIECDALKEERVAATLFSGEVFKLQDVPQAFRHFVHSETDGRDVVCRLKGVWDATEGFKMSASAFHTTHTGRKYAKEQLPNNHHCSPLCVHLNLKPLKIKAGNNCLMIP